MKQPFNWFKFAYLLGPKVFRIQRFHGGSQELIITVKCLSHLDLPTEVFTIKNPIRQFILGPAGMALDASIMMIVMVVVGLHMVQANFNGNVSIRLC